MQFIYDEKRKRWVTKTVFQGRDFEARVRGDYEDSEIEPIVQEVLSRMTNQMPALEENLKINLYDLLYEDCKEFGLDISAEEFKATVRPIAADISSNTSYLIYFSDDHRFTGGHGVTIHIRGDRMGEATTFG